MTNTQAPLTPPRASQIALAVALLLSACGTPTQSAAALDLEPAAFETHACASCGMYLREQSAPRGQAIHHDGTRVFFCSVSELVVYTEAPSPHGAIEASYVEVMTVEDDPSAQHLTPHPWQRAETAGFVVDIERNHVMGVPAMAYDSAATAADAAKRHSGTAATWEEFRKRALRIPD
jgi:nitrous oxide reductase accessory protein NosL